MTLCAIGSISGSYMVRNIRVGRIGCPIKIGHVAIRTWNGYRSMIKIDITPVGGRNMTLCTISCIAVGGMIRIGGAIEISQMTSHTGNFGNLIVIHCNLRPRMNGTVAKYTLSRHIIVYMIRCVGISVIRQIGIIGYMASRTWRRWNLGVIKRHLLPIRCGIMTGGTIG